MLISNINNENTLPLSSQEENAELINALEAQANFIDSLERPNDSLSIHPKQIADVNEEPHPFPLPQLELIKV